MLNMPVVDAHVHLLDPANLSTPWLADIAALNRRFDVQDFGHAADDLPIEKIVCVEAGCAPHEHLREVEWVVHLAQQNRQIAGVVAFADLLDTATLDATLDALSAHALVCGIRHNIQFHEKGFCLQDDFVRGVNKVAAKGWPFEICITHDQMDEAVELVGRCPEAQFVLDHCGKPNIADTVIDPWQSQIERLAALPNIVCKISGLLTEADLSQWSEDDIRPYVAHAAACFGAERVMYGGDWPVLTLAGAYRDWFELTLRLTDDWSHSAREAFYYRNAARVYRLA